MRNAGVVVLLVGLGVGTFTAGCKKKPVTVNLQAGQAPPPSACKVDADCELVEVQRCCSCCPPSLLVDTYGIAKDGPRYTRKCAMDCPNCTGQKHALECELLSAEQPKLVAKCLAGVCGAKPPPRPPH
ncbi:MAG: hypothetical protein U0174_08500 [Polyangiaceae bacterium]